MKPLMSLLLMLPRFIPMFIPLSFAACDRAGPADVPAAVPAADDAAKPAVPEAPQQASNYRFELRPPAIDLGILRPDEDASALFEVVNTDTRPLRLRNIVGSCDCLAFFYERRDIPPGGTLKVRIEVHAHNRGVKAVVVYVQAADREVTTIELGLRYALVPDLTFDPREVSFGRRAVGNPSKASVTAIYRLPVGMVPFSLEPRLDATVPLTVTMGALTAAPSAGGLQEVRVPLELDLDATRPVKSFQAHLVFESPLHQPARLTVTGEVHPGYYLDHEQIHLGVARIGVARKTTLQLFWNGVAPKILAFETSAPELTASEVPGDPGRALPIEITLQPTTAGDFDGEVRLRIDRAAEPLIVHVKAKVR